MHKKLNSSYTKRIRAIEHQGGIYNELSTVDWAISRKI